MACASSSNGSDVLASDGSDMPEVLDHCRDVGKSSRHSGDVSALLSAGSRW
jgi:hypothetical protein